MKLFILPGFGAEIRMIHQAPNLEHMTPGMGRQYCKAISHIEPNHPGDGRTETQSGEIQSTGTPYEIGQKILVRQ